MNVITRSMARACKIPVKGSNKAQVGVVNEIIDKEALQIVDVPNENKFIMKLGGENGEADVEYNLNGDVYDLVFSNVPGHLQGQGLGKILAQKTFDLIVEKNKKMKLTCEFLDHFYQENKQAYSKHVVA